jgi:hypothetical protein
VIRPGHHGRRSIRARQAAEVFQSSTTSWSSKIITDGTVDSSQRTSGSAQLSWYSRAYPAKSAAPSGSRSAYTWSPSSISRSGRSRPEPASRTAYPSSASGGSRYRPCGCTSRHEPKTIRTGSAPPEASRPPATRVRITGAGRS